VIVGVFLAVGAMFGLIEVGVVALAREYGHTGAAGLMLGLWAAGSLVSGTVYGAIQWRSDPARRFQVGAAAMAVGCILISVSTRDLALVTVSLIIAGLANAPTLITGNTLASAVVPHDAIAEAYTWLSVAVFAGIAVGSPLGGVIIDRFGPSVCLTASIVAGTVAAVLATTCNRFIRPRAPRDLNSSARPSQADRP
jgi:predicted MFS family arabinose efflux permease